MILIIFKQVLVMFLLSAVGYIMYRTGKISNEGSKNIGNILIFLSLPCVIINGFLVEYSSERLAGLLYSSILSLAVLFLSMLLSRILCGRDALNNFGGSFSNPGFFGVPIIVASFGSGAVFYIAPFIAFLNILQWTYGVSLLKNSDAEGLLPEKKEKGAGFSGAALAGILKRLIKAPFMVAILIGLFFFLTRLPMPALIGTCISHIAAVNTPLAMFTIGVYAAQTDLGKMFTKRKLYLVTLVKLLIIPIVTLVILHFIPLANEELKTCILIAAACPVGSNIAVYAQLHDKNYRYAVETVVISTIFSILSLPFIVGLTGIL